MNELIKVIQLPVIEEKLKSLKAGVEKDIKKALALPCTEETVKDVKQARASLKKDFEELEEQRKAVKRKISEPYEAFEEVYKKYVSELYKNADNTLKEKIDGVESAMLEEKKQNVIPYFNELCEFYGIDFVEFEDLQIKILKSTSEKAIKEIIDISLSAINGELKMMDNLEETVSRLAKAYYTDRKYGMFLRALPCIETAKRHVEALKSNEESNVEADENEKKALEKVEQAMLHAPTEESADTQELKMTFTVYGTKAQLKNIKQFLEKECIKYE